MTGRDAPTLWVDAVPRRLGLEAATNRMVGRDWPAAYLFVLFGAGLDAALSVVSAVRTGTQAPLLGNPFWLLLPLTLLFVVWSIRKFRGWYRALPDDIESRTAPGYGPDAFDSLVSARLRLAIYVLAVALYAGTLVVRGSVPFIIETVGPVVALLKFGVVGPFVYILVGAEFAAAFIEVHVRLPRLIRRADLAMDFTDPTDFGGMYQFGVLVKYSYYIFVVVLLLFLFWTYAPVLFSSVVSVQYPPPGVETTVQFGAMWLVGTGLLAHSVLQFHLHMAEAKEAKLREVTERIRDLTDDPHTIPDTDPSPGEVQRVRLEYDHLRRVKQVREYPIDLVMISQLVFSILHPVAVERLFNAVA